MVKAIFSNPIGRKIATTAMLTTAVLSTNAANLKNNNASNTTPQTEVVSKEAAEAIRVRFQEVRLQHFDHNKKMDKLILDTTDSRKETRNTKTTLDAIYKVHGTFGAMIELQRLLDDYYIDNAFDSYLNHYDMDYSKSNTAKEIISHFYGWRDNVYYTELYKKELKMFKKQGVPTADECIKVIDNHIHNKNFFLQEDVGIYEEFSNNFIKKQSEPNTVQGKSDLLAYKVHLLNAIAFSNYFFNENKMPKENILMVSLGYDFINGKGVIKP